MPQLMQGTPQWTLLQSSGREKQGGGEARSAGAPYGVQLSAYYLLAAAATTANVAVALEIIAPHVGRVESS